MAGACCPGSGWAPAWRTTWGWARPIQVLSLLVLAQGRHAGDDAPSLLVAPASLLANWAAEIARFVPGLKARIVHPSAIVGGGGKAADAGGLAGLDLAIHQLWLAAAPAGVDASELALRRPGRGAGRSRTPKQADQGRQGA